MRYQRNVATDVAIKEQAVVPIDHREQRDDLSVDVHR
jgi:hypothetical protein